MADALPTIDEILAAVTAGTSTVQQARVLIDLHVGNAVGAAFDRDLVATGAMKALMGDRVFVQEAINSNCLRDRIAAEAYRQADAMKTARTA